MTLREIDRLVHELIVDRYGAEIVRLAVKTSGTGLAHTDAIAASYGLNDVVANAPAEDTESSRGAVCGSSTRSLPSGTASDESTTMVGSSLGSQVV